MPATGKAEQIHLLRHSIARIEAGNSSAKAEARKCQRQAQIPQNSPVQILASGPRPPVSNIQLSAPQPARFYEIAPASAADCSAAAGFALTIAGQMVKRLQRPVLWVAEDFALTEQGAPYAPGLAAYGIAIRDFTLIRTRSRMDVWQVMEEAIKSQAFAAIIGEPAALAGRDLPALIRRLTVHARASQSCAILLRPASPEGFIAPSPLRFEIAASPASEQTQATHVPTGSVPAGSVPAGSVLASSVLASSVLARPLPSPPVWSVRHRGAPGSAARLNISNFHPEQPFRASLKQAQRATPSVSRAALLEEVTSMMIKERSSAALPVDISCAA